MAAGQLYLGLRQPARPAEQGDGLTGRPFGDVVPVREVDDVTGALGRRGTPPHHLVLAPEGGVPGDVDGALDELAAGLRRSAGGVDDAADEARRAHLVEVDAALDAAVVRRDGVTGASWVDVAEPAALQPSVLDDLRRVGEQGVDGVELGELGAHAVLLPELAAQAPALMAARSFASDRLSLTQQQHGGPLPASIADRRHPQCRAAGSSRPGTWT